MKLFGPIVVLCLLGILYAFLSYAQDSSRVSGRYTQAPGLDDGKILFFPSINQYRYYKDPDKLAELDRLAKKGNPKEVYDALYSYVMRFGPENFHKDHYLLWRLGKLAEQLGYLDKAKAFYQLVLKHHRYGNVKDYRLYYDSVTHNDKDYYLPVEYYYNLSNAVGSIDTLKVPESIYTALGDSVNAKYYNDYGPALSGNDRILLFTSQRKQRLEGLRHVPDEGLYYAFRADSLYIRETDEGSQMDTLPWTRARPFIGLNTDAYNEGSPCISKDGSTIFFARCGSPDGIGNCDLYYSRRKEDGTWTEGRNLGLMVNSLAWDSHPALSHTGDTLFFASDRLGGFGGADIYFTYKVDFQLEIKGQEVDTVWIWEKAQNIGPLINTRYNELSPFYHPVYNVLYFSSDGHLVNFGGFDIYRTYRRGPVWTTPHNIGPLVNYKTDEYYFTIDSRALNLYYAKGVRTKVYDAIKRDSVWKEILNLHTAALPMEAQPEARVRFEVMVTDSITGEISKGFVSIIDLDDGIEVAPRYIREDGTARFDLIRDKNYLIIISGDDFLRIEREFLLKGDTTLSVNAPSIKFRKWKFESIEFEEASAKVTDEMKPDLEKLVLFLADHPQLGLKISGHTDSRGNANDNVRLSQARADAIRTYILQRGRFKPDRIEARGFGDTQPIVPDEKTDEDRFKNRRVEFEILRLVP